MKVLYLLMVLDMLNTAIFLPAFGPYIRSLGGTPATLGFINSSAGLISFLWNPVAGSLSDQNGRRGLLIKCLLASAIGSAILSVASSSLFLIYIGRLIGAFGNTSNSLLRTVVADVYKKDEDKKRFFDKCGPILSITFLCGSVATGFLSEINNGYAIAFLLMAVTTASANYIVYTYLQNDDKTPEEQSQNSTNSPSLIQKTIQELSAAVKNLKSLSWSRYWDIFVIKGFYDFSVVMLMSNLGFFFINQYGLKGRKIGYVFVCSSLCTIISNILKLKFTKRLAKIPDYIKIVLFGMVVFVCYLVMAVSTSLYICLASLGVFCMTKIFLDAFLSEIIITRSMDSDRGRVFSAFDNMFPLASILAPALSGLFAKAFGERLLFATAAVAVSVAIAVAYTRKDKKD